MGPSEIGKPFLKARRRRPAARMGAVWGEGEAPSPAPFLVIWVDRLDAPVAIPDKTRNPGER